MTPTPLRPQPSLRLDRRRFAALAGGLVAAGLLPRAALALAEPLRLRAGDWDATVIDDGTLVFPLAIVTPDAAPEAVVALLGAQVEGDMVRYPSNALLLRRPGETILIDAGTGPGVQPTGGVHLDSLRAAGVAPEAVTRVFFTHAHPDHLWGAVGADGAAVFPNATLHVAEAEWSFWTDAGLASRMPADFAGMVAGTQARLAAVAARVERFAPGAEVARGVVALDAAGHTPGHVAFEIAGGEGLVVVGDAVVAPAVFFPNPDWRFGFDTDGAASAANRRRLLDRAAADRLRLLGYHWPAPGLAYAERRGSAYGYVAA